jgi:hypothetical protein
LISSAVVAIIAMESVMFVWQLRAAGNRELRSLLTTLLRAAFSLAATCALLSVVPGTWAHVDLTRGYALLAGGAVGGLTFAVFFACQAALWILSGRPASAESRIAGLLKYDPRVRRVLQAWHG